MTKKKPVSTILIIGPKSSKALKWLKSLEDKNNTEYHIAPDAESALHFLSKNKVDIVASDNTDKVIQALDSVKSDNQSKEGDLTGLLNHQALIKQLEQTFSYAKRYKILCAILYVDLDNFKPINDLLGRQEGDKLLQEVADRIHRVIRKADLFARVGGDEFIVVLTQIKQIIDAGRVAKKINEALKFPFHLKRKDYYITSSIGIAIYPTDNEDPETLVQYADMAMSIVKRKGKQNYQYHRAELNQTVEKNIRIMSDLRTAIDSNQLSLHFQPLVESSSHNIIGVETLVRWNHPEFGNLSPAVFIPLAEETGLITLLTAWILEEACRICQKWEKKGLKDFHISINLSVKDFQQKKLIENIESLFQRLKVDPHRFVLEITESVFAEDQEAVKKKIDALKKLGFKIALDDFGTGYSSLTYLRNLPIDIIKIDKTFIHAIEKAKKSAQNDMVCMIIDLAKRLGIKTMAEGVETPLQADFLKHAGCEYFQGFLFSKPVEFKSATEILKKKKITPLKD